MRNHVIFSKREFSLIEEEKHIFFSKSSRLGHARLLFKLLLFLVSLRRFLSVDYVKDKCVFCSRLFSLKSISQRLWDKNKVIEKFLYVVDINFESAEKKMKIWEDTVDELIHKDNQSTYLLFIRIAKRFDTLNRRT